LGGERYRLGVVSVARVLFEDMIHAGQADKIDARGGLFEARDDVVDLRAGHLDVGVAAGDQHRHVFGELRGQLSRVVTVCLG